MSEEIKLLPCPFCGGEAEIVDARLRFLVRCTQCGCANVPKKWHGEFDEDGHRAASDDDVAAWKADAIAAWNTRAHDGDGWRDIESEKVREIVWRVTGCSDDLARDAATEIADFLALAPPQSTLEQEKRG